MKKYIFKMTPKEFMRKVIELYIDARNPTFYHPTIKRGRSHAISGRLEDLFSAFLAFNFTENYDLFVDQAISLNKFTMYPDIMLVKDNIIYNLIDIKTDLGWKRKEFTHFCRELNSKIKTISGKDGKIKDGISKERMILSFSKKVHNHIVIISDQNISKKLFEKHIDAVEKLSHIKVYILSNDQHPNVYDKDAASILDSIIIREDEFRRLMNNLTKN